MERRLHSMRWMPRSARAEPADAPQERDWIEASKGGDGLAFNRLVLRWEKSMYNLALRMLQDPDEAADATQEVFLSAFRGIGNFRSDARFSTWIYRIAMNECITRMRSRPPGVHVSLDTRETDAGPSPLPSSPPSQEGEFLLQERRARVRQALPHLTPDQRAVIELKFFQDLTFEEIAAVLRIPLSTVKSRLYAGLEVMKLRLAGETSRPTAWR